MVTIVDFMSIEQNKEQLITPDKISSKVAWIVYRWAVPLLLICVALRQIVLVYTVGLTPWKGGGFGMFSSVDKARSRLIVVEGITTEGKLIKIDINSVEDIFSTRKLTLLKAIPQTELLQELAYMLLDSKLQLTKNEGIYRLTQEKSSSSQVVRLQQVKVQVWNFHFDPQTHRIWYEPLSSKVEVSK